MLFCLIDFPKAFYVFISHVGNERIYNPENLHQQFYVIPRKLT